MNEHSKKLGEIRWFNALCGAFAQQGLDAEELFALAGLDPDQSADMPLEVLCDGVAAAWDIAVRHSRNPALGLTSFHPLSQLAVLSHALLSAATMRQALSQASRFLPLFWPMAHLSIDDQGGCCRLTLSLVSGRRAMPPAAYDFFASMVLNALQLITPGAPRILRVHRPGPAPMDPRAWRLAFGCPVDFACPTCCIDLEPDYVAQSIPTANAEVFAISDRLTEQLADQHNTSLSARLRSMLPGYLARGEVHRAALARSLGMSERTLCRRLSAEGTNFADLLDELRREAAQRHFRQGSASPTQIAYALGFTDPSAFYRACKRWFGSTPSSMRSGC